MKKLIILSLLSGSLLSTQAQEFSYEFTHVEQPIADKHIVSQKNIRKYTEWQKPPVTYWGPAENGVDAEMTFKFPINKTDTPNHLVANLASFNFNNRGGGSGTGYSSLWGSSDGKSWTLLLDNPTPDRIDSYKTYDQSLPKEVVSGKDIWIQVRLRSEGAPLKGYSTAQFSRSTSTATTPIFSLKEAIPRAPTANTTRPTATQPNKQWSPEQATGAPDTATAGDLPTAWASMHPDAGPEWLLVEFAKPVEVSEVRIRETFNPGAISKVEAISSDNKKNLIWEGTAQPSPAPSEMGVKPKEAVVSNKIKIHLDTTRVQGWNEIDAVELIGKDGSRQWAQAASASSTYADIPNKQPQPSIPQATNPTMFNLQELLGDSLINSDGSPVDPATLKDKFVGIYFSAHWCGPCRNFTPKLVEFRNKIPDQFEVVFASADRDEPSMLAYMKEAGMPWPALPFGSAHKPILDRRFNVRSIPTLVMLDSSGRLITTNARNDVASLSPKDALAKWKNEPETQKPEKVTYSAPPIMTPSKSTPPQNTKIAPGKSLLGCPIGSTEEEVIKKLGKPMANLNLGENESALLYYDGTALLSFIDGKLQEGKFSSSSLLIINAFNINAYYNIDKTPYTLPNGISIGNSLQKAKDILGDRLDLNKDFHRSSYLDGDFLITLNCSHHSGKEKNDLSSYTIYNIDVKKHASAIISKSVDPGKSIFGCPHGSTEAEIIKILGEPEGKVDLGSNKIGLFYNNSRALLILWDGALGGGLFKNRPMLQYQSSYTAADITISMTNGIALDGPLAKAKEVLGERFQAGESFYQMTYQEGESLVTIQSTCHIPNGISHEVANKDIKNYSINSIQIDPFSKAQVRSPSAGCGIPQKKIFPARQNPDKFNPTEMITVEGGTLSEKANLAGTKVESFQIAKYEVTNAEWMKIQSYAQKHGYTLSRPTRTDDPELPMESVSRREAMLWCNAKSEKEGLQPVYWVGGKIYKTDAEEPEMNLDANGYRLPTEAEWEFAARGGIHTKGYKFSGGNDMNEVAWHGDHGEKWARPVGTKKPNELSIHDMSGNVYEWVWDIDIPNFGILGGSYMGGADDLDLNYRSAGPLRKFARETGRARSIGFRLVRNTPSENKPPHPNLPAPKIEPPKSDSENSKKQQPAPIIPQETTSHQLNLKDLIGNKLIDADGSPVDPAILKDKFIGIYFSAKWCAPCRKFTPKLVEFRNQVPDQFEVVFASSDRDEPSMLAYMKEAAMPWPAIPFGSENNAIMNNTFKTRGIPALIVLQPSGLIVSTNARDDVSSLSPEDAINKWKAETPSAPQQAELLRLPLWFKTPSAPENILIDPGKSIFGCAYGASVQEVMAILGSPTCETKYHSTKEALFYGNDCILYFDEGKLCGVSINDHEYQIRNIILGEKAEAFASPEHWSFTNTYSGGWKLSNGIHPMMEHEKAKNITKENDNKNDNSFYLNNQSISYNTINRKGHAYIDSIKVLPPSFTEYRMSYSKSTTDSTFFWANPSKSIAGCPLGATKSKIINDIGPPIGTITFGENNEGLLYDNGHAMLLLVDGKLSGGEFYRQSVSHNFEPAKTKHSFELSNGIYLGMPLNKTKTILGDQLVSQWKTSYNQFRKMKYIDGQSLVTISSERNWGRSRNNNNPDIDAYDIESIQISPISNAFN